jgi:transcriptional regulator with XRE-family HTH domain
MNATLLAMMFASTEDADLARRQILRTALRRWRSSVDPAQVDLPARARRRPGLTREDVAELAGLSIGWYTQYENASPKHRCSPRVVDRVADVLQLSPENRALLQIFSSREAFHSIRLILDIHGQPAARLRCVDLDRERRAVPV